MAKAMIAQPTGDLYQHFCMHVLQGALLSLSTALAELAVQLSLIAAIATEQAAHSMSGHHLLKRTCESQLQVVIHYWDSAATDVRKCDDDASSERQAACNIAVGWSIRMFPC